MTDWESRETRNGQTLTRREWALIADAEAAAGIPAGTVVVTQGSWSDGGQSAGTHAGGGAADMRVWNLPAGTVEPLVVELRRRNTVAWLRDATHGPWSGGDHIHCLFRDNPGLSASARRQIALFDRGLNGLANNGRDYHERPAPHYFDPEDDMALTDDEIERIAEAVWRRTVKVDGVERKMGAMAVSCYRVAQAQLPAGAADEPA